MQLFAVNNMHSNGIQQLNEKVDKHSENNITGIWQPDHEAIKCGDCGSYFNNNFFQLTSGKHHCRRCGLIFCNKCCNNVDFVPFQYWDQLFHPNTELVKTCNDCHKIIQDSVETP